MSAAQLSKPQWRSVHALWGWSRAAEPIEPPPTFGGVVAPPFNCKAPRPVDWRPLCAPLCSAHCAPAFLPLSLSWKHLYFLFHVSCSHSMRTSGAHQMAASSARPGAVIREQRFLRSCSLRLTEAALTGLAGYESRGTTCPDRLTDRRTDGNE
jgi:hypothetical protein